MLLQREYNRARAVQYAQRWALGQNPLYTNFKGIGGDCTNFVSQCILAGSCQMNPTPTYGWFYRSSNDRAPAWSSVEFLYDFLTGVPAFAENNGGIGPYASEMPLDYAELGDVIQLANDEGDYYHTLIISGFTEDDILVCAHTDDSLDRPLSTYQYARLRMLHILGVRVNFPEDNCFEALYEGISIPEV